MALSLCLAFIGAADTLDDIMAAHRKVVSRLSLGAAVRSKLSALDTAYEQATRADLAEMVSLPRSSPRREMLANKMKKANAEHRSALAQLLGPKWPAYQRAFAALVPSSRNRAVTNPGTSKGKARPTAKKSKKRT